LERLEGVKRVNTDEVALLTGGISIYRLSYGSMKTMGGDALLLRLLRFKAQVAYRREPLLLSFAALQAA
jgi:hypothetical protein